MGGEHFRLALRRAIKAVEGTFLLAALQVRLGRVTNGVLSFNFYALFRFLPYPHSRLVGTKDFTVLAFVFESLVREVGQSGRRVLVLGGRFRGFLHDVSVQGARRSKGASSAIIHVRRVVAQDGLVRFFRKRNRFA